MISSQHTYDKRLSIVYKALSEINNYSNFISTKTIMHGKKTPTGTARHTGAACTQTAGKIFDPRTIWKKRSAADVKRGKEVTIEKYVCAVRD